MDCPGYSYTSYVLEPLTEQNVLLTPDDVSALLPELRIMASTELRGGARRWELSGGSSSLYVKYLAYFIRDQIMTQD